MLNTVAYISPGYRYGKYYSGANYSLLSFIATVIGTLSCSSSFLCTSASNTSYDSINTIYILKGGCRLLLVRKNQMNCFSEPHYLMAIRNDGLRRKLNRRSNAVLLFLLHREDLSVPVQADFTYR
jgi:hypothetical protein